MARAAFARVFFIMLVTKKVEWYASVASYVSSAFVKHRVENFLTSNAHDVEITITTGT